MGDDLWMGRFLLHRTAEEFGVVVSMDPKPMQVNIYLVTYCRGFADKKIYHSDFILKFSLT